MTITTLHTPGAGQRNPLNTALFVLLFAPFYLNDFANIYIHDWRMWLAIDYVFVKALPLLRVARGQLSCASLGLETPRLGAAVATLLLAAGAGVLLDQNGYAAIAKLPGYVALGGLPEIGVSAVNWIDLTFGLVLVGLVEEIVFRAVLAELLARGGVAVTVAISSLAFGLIHWSGGLHVVVVTTVIGAVFMLIYLRWRALLALALAHALVDFVDFAGVVPKQIFKLLY